MKLLRFVPRLLLALTFVLAGCPMNGPPGDTPANTTPGGGGSMGGGGYGGY